MRGGKSLVILLVVALGLGAYIYFVESKRDLTDPATARDKVFSIETGKIEELEVRTPAGETTTLRKAGDLWQIVTPIAAEADQSATGSIISTLETMEIQRPLEDNPATVTPYGLEPARMTVTFRVAGESTPRRLLLGSRTPTGSDVYARVDGQPKLFLVASYLEDALNRTTFDLRDKTVLKLAREAVDSVTLGGVSLTRSSGTWRLSAPMNARADATAVDTAISRVTDSQMKSIESLAGPHPSPAELRKFGLDRPQFVATFGQGSTRASLAFGTNAGTTGVYARDVSRPLVFVVEPALLTDLMKKPDDFRVKHVFDFRAFSAKELTTTQAGISMTFAKTEGPANADTPGVETWNQTKPTAKSVNQTAMNDLLNTLSSLTADAFVAQPLARGEDVVIVARSGEDTAVVEETVTLRRSGATVHAIRAGEPGAAVVPVADVEKALAQLKDLASAK